MIGPVPKKPSGNTPAALYMQAQWESTYGSGRAQSTSGARVNRTTRGFSVGPSIGGSGSLSSVRKFKLRLAHYEYLICRSWDGTTLGTTDIYVAKQVRHRSAPPADTIIDKHHYALNALGDPVRVEHELTFDADPDEPFLEFEEDEDNDWGEVEADYEEDGDLFETVMNEVRTVTVNIPESSEGEGDESIVTEEQRIYPVWRRGEIIYAINARTGVIAVIGEDDEETEDEDDPPDIPVKLLHCCESRQWARIN